MSKCLAFSSSLASSKLEAPVILGIDVRLSADKDEVKPGESFDYTIKYKNIGKAKCDNAELMLSLPKYLSFLSDTSGSSQNDGGNYY